MPGFFPSPAVIAALPLDGALPRRAIPFIWHFVKKLRLSILSNSLCYACAQVAMAIEPWFIGLIIAALAAGQPDRAGWIALVYILVCQVLARLLWQVGHAMENHNLPVLTMLVRRSLADYLHGHSYGYFQDDMSGRLAGKVLEMPQAVNDAINETTNAFQQCTLLAVVSTVLFAILDWRFGLCALAFYGLTFLNARWRLPELGRRSAVWADTLHKVRGRFYDSISNVLLVKLFARQRHEDTLLVSAMTQTAGDIQAARYVTLQLWRGQHILNALLQMAVLGLCLLGWRNGQLDLAKIAIALPLCLQMVGSIWWMLFVSTTYFTNLANIQDGLNTILQAQKITDADSAQAWQPAAGAITIGGLGFGYADAPIFTDFSLAIPAGQRVGLIGPSGAGKSTLIQLLLRLHDLNDGTILIDGQDITAVRQDDLRRAIAMIPQQADLLHRSIADNIRYGKLDATEAAVEAAARAAHAHDFILGLPDGYASQVGERGVKLSGGQRQRIAIARAFIKAAPILILDEPTSALDSESERLIQQSLARLMQGRTAIVIAHRLSTIAHLDRIVVLDRGRIVADGTHADLLAQGGLYARLWQLQTDGFLADKTA